MKKTMPLVSVIIPVYDTATYLAECLDSVINQGIRDMEIIVVNDGSMDGSLDIIRRYSELDDRIILLDKANQGASAARNDAMRMAKADYIMFLDSDDFFTADVVKTAYDRICRNACEIIIFNGRAFEDDGKIRRWCDKFYFNLEEGDENHIAPGLYWIGRTGGRIQQPGMKIYHREFIIKNNLKFGNSLVGEDYYFFYMCMIRAERVGYMHFEGYSRRYRPGSQETDKSIHGTQERIRSFGQILSTLNFVDDEKYHRIIGGQHAYYASVLWVRCMIRQDTSERNALLKEFCNARLKEFIRKNRNDWKLRVLSFFISLPESLLWLQIIFARAVRLSFKSKIRLLY
jgi:glycosyltransferase involved in cell wall biosynthesis